MFTGQSYRGQSRGFGEFGRFGAESGRFDSKLAVLTRNQYTGSGHLERKLSVDETGTV